MKVEKSHLYWIGGIFLVFLIWKFGIVSVQKKVVALDKKIARKEEVLKEIKSLQNAYSRFKAGRVVGDLPTRERDFTPLAFLEKLSMKIGVKDRHKLTYKEPRKFDDEHLETSVSVELNGIDMGQLLNYLYDVENSPELLRIKNVHIIRQKDGLLEATFEVSTLIPAH